MKEDIYYNYLYLDPEKPGPYKIKGLDIILTHEPFYVGKGKNKRYKIHTYGFSSKFMINKLNSIKTKGYKPIIVKIISNISNEESCENEKYLIKVIGRRDLSKGPLCNLTDGGEGSSGHKKSEETKFKLSVLNKGKKLSKEHKEKISETSKNRKDWNKGMEAINNFWQNNKRFTNPRKVKMLDLDDNIIKIFNSLTEAGKEIGLGADAVFKQCKFLGKCKNKPFKFRYNDI